MDLTEFQRYRENKVHTDSSFPYNTYLCSIPLDFPCVPHHWHDEMELIVIQKGSGVVHVDFNMMHLVTQTQVKWKQVILVILVSNK